MQSGKHAALPKTELAQFESDLRLQADVDGVAIDIAVTDNNNGTVDVSWTVSAKGAGGVAGAVADAVAGAAAAAAAHPVATAAVAGAAAAAVGAAAAFVLGKLSEKYEVGNRGVTRSVTEALARAIRRAELAEQEVEDLRLQLEKART